MTVKNSIIPEFGPLAGVRVLSLGSIVAGPNTANLLADFGAEVVHIERPGVGDTLRVLAPFAKHEDKRVSTTWAQDARNRLSLTMEFSLDVPECKEMFMDLVKSSDILVENMVWLEKLGIYNEELLAANPKLVICHISGFGRPQFGGDPEICDRASYDMIGQAYGGYAFINGNPEPAPPAIVKPWFNDYLSSYVAAFGILSAYINAEKTGKGQEVDLAQFEACAKLLADTVVTYSETGAIKRRSGPDSPAFQPYGLFQDKNGAYMVIGAYGPGVYKRAIQAFGLDINTYSFAEAGGSPQAMNSERGKELRAYIVNWCGERTCEEIVKHMAKFKVPASKINSVEDIINDPHWIDRGDIITYRDETLEKDIKAVGIIPKLSGTPGKVWRGAPTLGQDTDEILKKVLGYSQEKIEVLKEKKLI
jgi:crotonobetainyl-CoA:carnitine CoA-transferase CaiB-like acyl-CoA transferase